MKKFLLVMSTLLVMAGLQSCNDQFHDFYDLPTVSFKSAVYTQDADSVMIKVCVDPNNLPEPLDIPFTIAGTAVKGTDYTVEQNGVVTIPAGRNSAFIKIKALHSFDNAAKEVRLTLTPGYFYKIGEVNSTALTLNRKETLIYTFDSRYGDLMTWYDITLTLRRPGGTQAGFAAEQEMSIPFTVLPTSTATVEKDYTIDGNPTAFVIPQGGNSATIRVRFAEGAVLNRNAYKLIEIGLNQAAIPDRTFKAGAYASTTLSVRGPLMIEELLGTWRLSNEPFTTKLVPYLISNPDAMIAGLLPINNANFRLEITQDEETGVITVTPVGSEYTLAQLFRTATMDFTEPVNMHIGTVDGKTFLPELNGEYSTFEGNAWMAYNAFKPQATYFMLSQANLSFDDANEDLGPMPIAIQMNDSKHLYLRLRQYNKPPFAGTLWDDSEFLQEYGFCYTFVKV